MTSLIGRYAIVGGKHAALNYYSSVVGEKGLVSGRADNDKTYYVSIPEKIRRDRFDEWEIQYADIHPIDINNTRLLDDTP